MPEVTTKQQFWRDADGFHDKAAEAANTYLMPGQEPADKKPVKQLAPVVNKSASAFEQYIKTGAAELPDDNLEHPVTGKQPEQMPQCCVLKPHVDVSGKEPPKLVTEKKAEYYALPSHQRYPIDSIVQIKTAAAYFTDNRNHFHPRHRREFCSNLVKRASMVGEKLTPEIRKYGSATYAHTPEFDAAVEGRKCLLNEDNSAVLDKLASMRLVLQPDDFALALHEFDKLAGLDQLYDRDIPDPYFSTFGKTAESDESFVIGNDIMSDEQLKTFAKTDFRIIKDTFGDDMAAEFKKDPHGIFNSLPIDQKKMIIRMATDNSPK
jgi:hypothetical protein